MDGAVMVLMLGAAVVAVGIAVELVRLGDHAMATLLSGSRVERG